MITLILMLAISTYQLGLTSGCNTDCKECWGGAANNCYSCNDAAKYVQTGACVTTCNTGYIGDSIDRLCKKSRNYNEYPCPPGTYNKVEYSQTSSACIPCEGGNACETYGMSTVGNGCAAGYQCLAGAQYSIYTGSTSDPYTSMCQAGYYSPGESATCLPCPVGKYCQTAGLSSPTGDCTAGYYCSGTTSKQFPMVVGSDGGRFCSIGYYCPAGTTIENKCPEGTYRDTEGGVSVSSCFTCPPGYYCTGEAQTAITGPCAPGYFCPAGTTTANPATSVCPPGYRCPGSAGSGLPGSADKEPCDAGYYQDTAGQISCILSTAGTYIDFDENKNKPCLAGYYCTSGNIMTPCLRGTYNSNTGSSASTDCFNCVGGYACEIPGTSSYSSIKCAAGYYCPTGSYSRYQNQCPAGSYCPEGSAAATSCDAGKYCLGTLNSAPTAACPEGFYCPTGTATSEANKCTTGNYCPIGSSSPTPCPIGTYGPSFGATKAEDCIACKVGDYCSVAGTVNPTLVCSAGYYCPRKQTEAAPDMYQCPAGYKCPPNSFDKLKCPIGTYQPNRGQSLCLPCDAMYYCDGSDTTRKEDCPQGYFCPAGTSIPVPCPIGTYNDEYLKTDTSNCKPCKAGFYCPNRGQAYSVDECPQGYYCPDGSRAYKPDWLACPISKFCPNGTGTPFDCPDGTYLNTGYAFDYTDCTACTPGYYCIGSGKTLAQLTALGSSAYGQCMAGYFCTQGSSLATPIGMDGIGDLCPVGYYCPTGNRKPLKCPIGTFARQTGQTVCDQCTAGYYCNADGMSSILTCSATKYCPTGSRNEYPCPPGTLSSRINVALATSCSPCPLGYFCELYATSTGMPCPAGFVCLSSADERPMKSFDANNPTNSKCPKGSYCPAQSYSPQSCDPGQYQNSEGGLVCKDCPRGYYCEVYGVISPVYCEAGYLCTGKSDSPTPTSIIGKKCTPGYYCPSGTAFEVVCPDGYYSMRAGSETCDQCPDGYMCSAEGSKSDCPAYHYCPRGSKYKGLICEAGTYTDVSTTRLRTARDCLDCPKGKYCVDGGLGNSLSNCIAGYLCLSKANSPKPNIDTAFPCPAGGYCDEGATSKSSCPTGKVRGLTGGRQVGDCSSCEAGYYCQTGDPIPKECPVGYYCPLNSELPKECPLYTFNIIVKAEQKYGCISCPSGYFCDSTRISDLSQYPCPTSHFCGERCMSPITCPGGYYIPKSYTGGSSSDCMLCPEGRYCPVNSTYEIPPACESKINGNAQECPAGSIKAFKCTAGYYCKYNTTGSIISLNKRKCPYNYYCPEGTSDPIICPIDYVCLAGSSSPTICPFGSFLILPKPSSATLITDVCYLCPAGYYAGNGTCKLCAAGYVCTGNTFNKYPVNKTIDNGYECPPGFYCPAGCVAEISCPVGTYRALKRAQALSDCLPCEADSFNDQVGQHGCKKCGTNAVSVAGSTSCTCIGKFREFHKTDSSCRCIAGYYFMVNGIVSKVDDSSETCSPIVEEKCAEGETLDFEHKCVSTTNCTSMCPSGGKYSDTNKICMCDTVEKVSCNSACKASQPVVTIYNSTHLKVSDPATANVSYLSMAEKANIYFGSTNFSSSSKVKSVELSSTGQFKGNYGAISALQGSARRMMDSSSTSVSNPIICSEEGESVAFGISASHYPVYLKDSLLNTVKDFDYGSFTTLEQRLQSSSITTSAFVFTFNTVGTYHFGDSSNNAMQMIVKVIASGSKCPDDFILPFSEENLMAMGVKARTDVLTSHKLYIYLILMGGVLVIVSACIVVIEFIKPSVFDFIDTSKQNVFSYDRKKFALLEDDDKKKKLKEMLDKNVKGADILVLKEMKNKLNDLDTKMQEALKNGQKDRKGKLKDLCDKIKDLDKIIQQHYNSLVLPTGNSIDNALSPYENGINKDTDYESILTQNSEKHSSSSEIEQKEEIRSEHIEENDGVKPKAKGGDDLDIINQMEAEKNDEEAKDFEAQKEKQKQVLDQEFEKRKEKIKEVVQTDDKDIKEIVEDYTLKLTNIKQQLENEMAEKSQIEAEKLKERAELRKKGNQLIVDLKKKQDEDRANFRSVEKGIKTELKGNLKEIDNKIEAMKREGFKKLDDEENKQFTDLRDKFKQDISKVSEQSKIDRLLHEHEVEKARLEEFLKTERVRQQEDIDKRLKEKREKLRKDVVDRFKVERDALRRKHDTEQAKINQVKFMAIVDHGLQPVDVPTNFTLNEEEQKQIKDIKLKHDIDLDILANKKKNEEEAAEKDTQMYEQDIRSNLSKSRKDTEVAINTQLTKLREDYLSKIRQNPIGDAKQKLLAEYEEAKTKLTDDLKKEGNNKDKMINRRLEERKRQRDDKKMQAGITYEEEKLKKEIGFMKEKEKQEDELIQQKIVDTIAFSITNGNILKQNIPHVLDLMINQRNTLLSKSIADRHNHQMLKTLSNLYEKTFRDKFAQLSQLKENYITMIKQLDELPLNTKTYELKMQSLVDKFNAQKDALNIKFENVEIEKEIKARKELVEEQTDEKIRAMEDIRGIKEKILTSLYGKLPDFDPKSIKDSVAYIYKKTEENQLKEIDKLKAIKKAELERIEKEMSSENEQAIKEIEAKAKDELETEAKEIELNFARQKNKLIEEHKQEMQERLSKVNELNVETRSQIMAQYQKDIEGLEAALAEERQAQLERTKLRLLSKKIQQQRMKTRAERRLKERLDEEQKESEIAKKPKEELKEFADEETDNRKQSAVTPSELMAQELIRPGSPKKAGLFVNYRLQLRNWVEKTKEEDTNKEDAVEEVKEKKKEEKKKERKKLEDNGGFVNFNELFEKIISCEDLITNLNAVELPQIDEVISKLGEIMIALEKGKSLLTGQVKGIDTMKYK